MDFKYISSIAVLTTALAGCNAADSNEPADESPNTGTNTSFEGVPTPRPDAPATTAALRLEAAQAFANDFNGTLGSILSAEDMIETYAKNISTDVSDLGEREAITLEAIAVMLEEAVGEQMAPVFKNMIDEDNRYANINFSAAAGKYSLDNYQDSDLSITYSDSSYWRITDGGDTGRWEVDITATVKSECDASDTDCDTVEREITWQHDATLPNTALAVSNALGWNEAPEPSVEVPTVSSPIPTPINPVAIRSSVDSEEFGYEIDALAAELTYFNLSVDNFSLNSAGATLNVDFINQVDEVKQFSAVISETDMSIGGIRVEGSAEFSLTGNDTYGLVDSESSSNYEPVAGEDNQYQNTYESTDKADIKYSAAFEGMLRTSAGDELIASIEAEGFLTLTEEYASRDIYTINNNGDRDYIEYDDDYDFLMNQGHTMTATAALNVGDDVLEVALTGALEATQFDDDSLDTYKLLTNMAVTHNGNEINLGLDQQSIEPVDYLDEIPVILWHQNADGDVIELRLQNSGDWDGVINSLGYIWVNGEAVAPIVEDVDAQQIQIKFSGQDPVVLLDLSIVEWLDSEL